VQASQGSWHTILGWGVVCVSERQTTLALDGSKHTAYKGGARANEQTTSSSMQMSKAWAIFWFV
jgi:hypothetical protein